MRYLVIGGGITGTTAAEMIRQHDPEGVVTVISDEPYPLYSRVMLSKPGFFTGAIPFEKVWLKKAAWYAEKKIELITGKSAVRLDPKENIVELNDGAKVAFDKLLVAPGLCARRWSVPGADKRGIHYLRTLDDSKGVMEAIKTAKRAVVVGGGFIGFETCEILREAGLEVTAAIREKYFWEPLLDEQSGRMIESALEKGGVRVIREAQVKEVLGKEAVEGVLFSDGTTLPCDVIVAGIGAFCAAVWVQQGGIEINRGVIANKYLETNRPGVWAAGDACEFDDVVLGERAMNASWLNAQMQGRTAGINMVGKQRTPYRLVSFVSAHGFGTVVSFVGNVAPIEGRRDIIRGSLERGWLVRLALRYNEIVGATIINRNQDIGALTTLIEKDVDVSGMLDKLADPDVDLKSLLKP